MGTVLCLNWRKKNIKTQKFRESQRQRSDPTDIESVDQCPSQPNGLPQIPSFPSAFDHVDDPLPPVDEDSTVPERHPFEHNKPNQTVRWLARLDGKLRKVENILTSRPRRAPPGEQTSDIPMSIRLQWKTLTVVLDRLFIILFFLLNVIALVLFYPRRT